jgi:hypothetical protein
VYYKFRIPRRDDNEGWRDLKTKVREVNAKMKARAVARLQADAARFERVLASTPGASRAIRQKLRDIETVLAAWRRWP